MKTLTIRPPSNLMRAIGAIDHGGSVPAGFSGAQVFRVATASGDRAVKAWPQATKSARVAEVHRVQRLAGDLAPTLDTFGGDSHDFVRGATGGIALPGRSDGVTWISSGGRLWESSTWLSGTPLPVHAPIDDVLRGVDVIATIHRRMDGAAPEGFVSRRPHAGHEVLPPAITDRIDYADRLARRIPDLAAIAVGSDGQRLGLESVLGRAVDRFRRGGADATQWISRVMTQHSADPNELRICLRDVHREHILFEPGSGSTHPHPSGVIDWDAIRWDTPATDLARWMGSFDLADHRTDELAAAAVDRYLADPPSSRAFSGVVAAPLVADLIRASAWISLGQWCVWLALEKRSFGVSPDRLARRIQHWIDQVARRGDFA